MRRRHLPSEQRQLCVIERRPWYGSEVDGKICRCDGRNEGGYVGEGTVEGGDGGIVEVVPWCDGLDLI